MATPETTDNYQPREFTTLLGETTVLVRCDYRWEEQAEWLLNTLKDIHQLDPINEGSTVEIGWSVLTFIKDDAGRLVACEPDFGDDPFEKIVADVTMTLHVVATQGYIIGETHTEETARIPRYDETVVYRVGALEAENIYAERGELDTETDGEGDSGWFIGDSDREDEDDDAELADDEFEACYVYELLESRPELLSILGLPSGYVAVFEGADLVAIMDENDNDVWNTEHTNGVL
jgi:hypothetical protein